MTISMCLQGSHQLAQKCTTPCMHWVNAQSYVDLARLSPLTQRWTRIPPGREAALTQTLRSLDAG